jgi:hypothetical protein
MRLLVARLWLWAVILRPLKHAVPLGALVRLMRRRAASGPAHVELVGRLDRIFRSTARFPRRAPSNCIERALGAYRLLCRAGVRPELVVGVRRSANGTVDGHTWVVVDGRAVGEDDARVAAFTRLMAFDAGGHRTAGPDRLPRGTRVA